MTTGDEVLVKEKSIRYTNLIRLIQEVAQDFILYQDLQEYISAHYPDVPIEIIESTICTLIDNEILLSILRLPAYCDDHLDYVACTIEKFLPNCNELQVIKLLQKLILEYKKNENISVLENIYKVMENLQKSNSYIILNKGNRLSENSLSEDIRIKVEKVMNLFYQMPIQVNSLQRFIEKFSEEYGSNVRVPLLEIIDKNGFNGIDLLSEIGSTETEMSKKLESLVNNKIFLAILNGENEVEFTEHDFEGILNQNLEYIKDCDVNFIISYNNEEYQLFLAPCGGSCKAGSMLQRFSNCFEESDLNIYNQMYQKINEIYQNEYVLVEAREYSRDGRMANIVNNNQNVEYCIVFGSTTVENKNELYLKDISVELTSNNQIFLYSETLQKRIKVMQENMLNPQLGNGITKLLLAISEHEEYFPEARIINFTNNLTYKYIPRIIVDDIVISTKRWALDEEDLRCKDIVEFSTKLQNCKQRYKIDTLCYSVKADHRILLNLDTQESLRILYKEYQKRKRLIFHELETNIENLSMIEDQKGLHYMGEFVFSLLTEKNIEPSATFLRYKNNTLDTTRRINILCEEGWIYFKLYGTGEKDNEILSQNLPELLERLNKPDHFFIRYYDSIGKHLRIRIKFRDSIEASAKIPDIINWSKNLMEEKIINNIVFDTYMRENNRYGGNTLIDAYERVFFKDAILIEKILTEQDLTEIENLEKWYISGITYFLMQMSNGIEDMLQKIDSLVFDNKYRKEYREHSKRYMTLVKNILNNGEGCYVNVELEAKQVGEVLAYYKNQLETLEKEKLLTNEINSIIFSVIHMHCNRLTGNRLYEEKYLEIVRNTIYHIVKSINVRKER